MLSVLAVNSVKIFKYSHGISLTSLFSNSSHFMRATQQIVSDCLAGKNLNYVRTLSIYPGLLEYYNIRYTEKWVRRIDENFLEYSTGTKPPSLNIPPIRLPKNLRYLSDKFFSGDVSGMIAESLFIYFLDELKVNITLVGHLRPLKRAKAYLPDFVIWDNSPTLRQLISTSNYKIPIYAEVKGSTGGITKEPLVKALIQLNKIITKNAERGIIFLAFRDVTNINLNYKGIVFEVGL